MIQRRIAFIGGGNHTIGFVQRSRDWLLNQHMHASLKQCTGDFAVRFGRHRQTHGIDFTDQCAPISGPGSISFGGN